MPRTYGTKIGHVRVCGGSGEATPKTIITVLDEKIDKEKERENYTAYWNKIIEDIKNSDEIPEGEPERIRFKAPEEIDIL